jgi:hypothetical protein
LEVAQHRGENASLLYEAAWLTILRPLGQPDEYRLAQRQLEAACRVVADDPARLAECRQALALAYYRAAQPARALEILRDLTTAMSGPGPSPLDLAVTAMASQRLGRTHDAHAALHQLRSLLQTDRWANDPKAIGFLHEAEGVIESPPAP